MSGEEKIILDMVRQKLYNRYNIDICQSQTDGNVGTESQRVLPKAG